MPRDRSSAGLDWLNFFVANVQTGFGPFIAAYLASQAWTQGQIGLALSIGTLTTVVVQMPAGAMVDAVRDKRRLATFAVAAIAGCALVLAALPERLPVLVAEVLHGVASCLLGPVIAALSLSVAQVQGHPFGERLGRNARFASIGSGIAAGLLGAVGYWVSERSVFILAAILVVPAFVALRLIRAPEANAVKQPDVPLRLALTDRRLLFFAVACAGFHFANAAMFPLAAVEVTRHAGSIGELVIAACLIVPQALVAVVSPTVGRAADRWGRRPVLLWGFAAVPLRAVLFALTNQPEAVVAIQALDGISGAVFGVMLPLVAADIARDSGRFNVSMGFLGLAIAAAAAASNAVTGVVTDQHGPRVAFLVLAGAGIVAFVLLWAAMPETRRTPKPATA